MTSISIDLDAATKRGIADAKSQFSTIINDAVRANVPTIITRYNKPVAAVVPLPQEPASTGRAKGLLAAYADPSRRELEDTAFAQAMKARHDDAS